MKVFSEYFFALIVLSLLLGCTIESENNEKKSKQQEQELTEMNKESDDIRTLNKPQVSSSTSGLSENVSEISKNAKIIKNKEIYIVPNQFPFQDTKKKKKDCKDSSKKKSIKDVCEK